MPQELSSTTRTKCRVALQASLLVRYSPAAVADAFCAARLAGEGGRVFGTLPGGVDARAIINRAYPV